MNQYNGFDIHYVVHVLKVCKAKQNPSINRAIRGCFAKHCPIFECQTNYLKTSHVLSLFHGWGLCTSMIWIAMLAGLSVLVGPPKPDGRW